VATIVKICHWCKGAGMVLAIDRDGRPIRKSCPKCRGSGKIKK